MENDTSKKVKSLKSYNGGEYCNNNFDNYFSLNGIRGIKVVTPKIPQENGILERMNMIIMECFRCLILDTSFHLYLWDNCVDIIIYLINRWPYTTLYGGILEETWIGKTVTNSFLRLFRCEAYAHID